MPPFLRKFCILRLQNGYFHALFYFKRLHNYFFGVGVARPLA